MQNKCIYLLMFKYVAFHLKHILEFMKNESIRTLSTVVKSESEIDSNPKQIKSTRTDQQ